MELMMADYYLHPERSPHVGKKKALYIYGYGGSQMSSSVEKLKRELPEQYLL